MQRIIDSVKSAVHPLAKTAFSASGSSGLYDRARPSYPPEALQAIADVLPTKARVVELGSGTGIFTRCLFSPSSPTSSKVSSILAVEPAEGMRAGFAAALKKEQENLTPQTGVDVQCVDGTFSEIPTPDASADLLVAAQAYHWIGTDPKFHDVCIAEAARALKPGAHFALIWNLEDRSAARWVASLRDIYEEFEADTPQYRQMRWRPIFDTPSFRRNFTLLPSGSPSSSSDAKPTVDVKRELPTTLEGVTDRVLSKSYIGELPEEKQQDLRRQIKAIWEKGEDLKWLDRDAGVAAYPYETHLYIMRKA